MSLFRQLLELVLTTQKRRKNQV